MSHNPSADAAPPTEPSGFQSAQHPVRPAGLQVLAQETLDLQGDTSRLVTFLNQSLKDRGLIFGLSRTSDQRFLLTIYRTDP